jgi:sulfatase maturation enzyme AslB (radical SAM superfamily)
MIEQLSLENTTLCGAFCIMCPRDKVDYKFDTMPLELWKMSLEQGAALGAERISVCGFGDPLMDNELEQKMKWAKETYPHIKQATTTTGHLLYGKMLDVVCKYFDVVKISNYGFSKTTYENVHRGVLKYEKIKENIDNYLSRKDRPYTIMTFLDLPENHHEMEAWKAYYEPLSDRTDIWRPRDWPNKTIETGWHIVPSKQYNKTTDIRPCKWVENPLSGVIVRCNGIVGICGMEHNRQIRIGNMYENKLADIIQGNEVKRIQKIFQEGTVMTSDLICKNCDQITDRSGALVYSNVEIKIGKRSYWQGLNKD